MSGRENDTALWLHNKLGSTDDLWSGRSICSQITKERLRDILGCFRSLQPHVKVKLLLSFIHVIKRNVEEWKGDLAEIIELAVSDRDQWVSTVGEIMKTFPGTFLVNTTDLSGSPTFHSMHTELKKAVRRAGESSTLPLECVCLGNIALSTTIPHPPQTVDHFNLKSEPKSSALRAEILSKSHELQSNTKRKGLHVGSVPMKIRRTAKRMDEEISSVKSMNSIQRNGTGSSNTGFLKANTLSSFSSGHHRTSSLAMRKEGGAKMLDISEMPPTSKEAKRKKKQEEQEAAAQIKKEKEEAAAAEKAAAAAKVTPDYAAGLGTNSTTIKSAMPRGPRPKAAAVTTTPSYLPNISPRPVVSASEFGQPYCYHRYGYNTMPYFHHLQHPVPYARELSAPPSSSALQSHTQRPVLHTTPVIPSTQSVRVRAPVAGYQLGGVANFQPRPAANFQTRPAMPAPQAIIRPAAAPQPTGQSASAAVTPSQTAAAAAAAAKKPLSLTKDQMMEAQEMFKNSNKVTRPEKALILGFMAGSRENPCPQQGHIVNIRLSEKVEPVRLQDNSIREVLSETFFQMNYETGEWRRIKKFKEPPQTVTQS